MKKLILILSIVSFYACKPIIKNNVRTLEKVFAMTEFEMEIQNWGCFGGSSELFSVKKENKNFLLKSLRTGKSHLVANDKMDSLKNYLKPRIGKEGNGGCTSSQHIRVGSFFNSVYYEHTHCSGMEATIINDLLNYRNLVLENELDESQ
jgi:hypothetical protein